MIAYQAHKGETWINVQKPASGFVSGDHGQEGTKTEKENKRKLRRLQKFWKDLFVAGWGGESSQLRVASNVRVRQIGINKALESPVVGKGAVSTIVMTKKASRGCMERRRRSVHRLMSASRCFLSPLPFFGGRLCEHEANCMTKGSLGEHYWASCSLESVLRMAWRRIR